MTTEQLAREAAEKCADRATEYSSDIFEPIILSAINRAVELERDRIIKLISNEHND